MVNTHSDAIALTCMFVNVGLTILQIVWLGEIVQTGIKMFSEEGKTVIYQAW